MYLCFFMVLLCGEKKYQTIYANVLRVSSVEVLAIKTSTSVAIMPEMALNKTYQTINNNSVLTYILNLKLLFNLIYLI